MSEEKGPDDGPMTAREFIARRENRETRRMLEEKMIERGETTRERLDAEAEEVRKSLAKLVERFEIKAGGERKTFSTGMQRDVDTSKIMWDLVYDGPMLERYAIHLTGGAVKYARKNWMQANTIEEMDRFRESAARHFAQWMAGDRDEDHMSAVVFNLNGYEYVRARLTSEE